jgi:glycosyltransferase involved in cell wall biosynthesis
VDAAVIPNGINAQRFVEAEPLERERPYLLTVGRLEEYKGVQHMIKTMPELPEYDLLVAGSGPYQRELAQISCREGVDDRVEFLGYVDDSEMPGLYSGADVYVTMSEFEAYGLTVAEALAAETPCVIREAGGLRNFSDTPGCVSVADPTPLAIAKAIRRARSLSVTYCVETWNHVTDQLIETYGMG